MQKKYTLEEVSQHSTENSSWLVIEGKVYDLTKYLVDHPGGGEILLTYAGKDATQYFKEIHAEVINNNQNKLKNILKLGEKFVIGECEVVKEDLKKVRHEIQDVQNEKRRKLPQMSQILNIYDLQDLAKQILSKEAWDYFQSGANDEVTLRENELAFQRIWLRPRILVNIKEVSSATRIFSIDSSFPCYISSTALAKLAHQDGEIAVIKAAANAKVIYMVPTLASISLDKIYQAKGKDQEIFFQLYMNSDKNVTLGLIKKAEEAGVKAIVLTVDAPFFAKRERDMRKRATVQSNVQKKIGQEADKSQGVSQVINQFLDSSTDWNTLKWLMGQTHLPFIIKGIQTYEDALLAYNYGAKAIVISNHGGRQLDFARSAIEVLQEVTAAFDKAGIRGKMQIYIDGGIRRGMDIFKALALGATAVGIGRPMLYGLSTYGQEGIEKVLKLLKDELEMCMKLTGAKTISEIKPEMCCAKDLTTHTVESPCSYLTVDLYEPLKHASKL